MRPVSNKPLQRGDLLLFEADMTHRGSLCNMNKTLLFFNVRKSSYVLHKDQQFHAATLGTYVYGSNPKKKSDKDALYGLIRMNDQSISEPVVPLIDLLNDGSYYNEWLKTQK